MSNEDQNEGPEDDGGGGGAAMAASVVLPFATAVAALAVGALVGGVIAWVAKPPEKVSVEVPRDYTAVELEQACAPMIAEATSQLEQAHEKVVTLSAEVKSKQEKVNALESEMKRRSERGAALVAELEAAKKELAEVKEELRVAKEEKERLVVQLEQTIAQLEVTEEKLDQQIVMTEMAKEDALVNKYYRFVNDSQLEICEKGNRKKLGKCRETVQAQLSTDDVRNKFSHCVRSGQATPSVVEFNKKEQEGLPEFAQWINQEEKVTKGWYLLVCDPTLPEADGLLGEEHLPKTDVEKLTQDAP